jgi:hypothetical protein
MKIQSASNPNHIILLAKCKDNHVPKHFEEDGDSRELMVDGADVAAYASPSRTIYTVLKISGTWFYTADGTLMSKSEPANWATIG